MANIEIHGSARIQVGAFEIFLGKRLQEKGMDKEVVISGFNTCPSFCYEPYAPAPFIRIWGDSKEEIERIIGVMKETGMTKLFDIETVILNSFVTKENGELCAHAISSENDTKASSGMFRATAWIDSDFYQIGEDVPTRDMAIVLLHGFKGCDHYAIYNDKGEIV